MGIKKGPVPRTSSYIQKRKYAIVCDAVEHRNETDVTSIAHCRDVTSPGVSQSGSDTERCRLTQRYSLWILFGGWSAWVNWASWFSSALPDESQILWNNVFFAQDLLYHWPFSRMSRCYISFQTGRESLSSKQRMQTKACLSPSFSCTLLC